MGDDGIGGLEGPAASLAGACVGPVFGASPGVGLTVAGDDAAPLFFWKKPRIVLWPFCDADADPEDVFFFSCGFGVAISLPSMPRAILGISLFN